MEQNKKLKGEEGKRWGTETANGKMTLTRQYRDLKISCINKCLVCSLVLWSVFFNKISFWHALST